MKTVTFILGIVIAAIFFPACERVSEVLTPTTAIPESTGDEIRVGIVLPLTGHISATGAVMKHGFDIALDEINASAQRHLKFIYVDDMSTPEGAVDAFQQLIDDGVSMILGPATSSATRAAFPIAEANQVLAMSPTAGARGLGEIGAFVFRVPPTTEVVIPKGITATLARFDYKRVATFYDKTDLFSTDRDQTLQETLTANGIEVLTTETFESGDTDFSPQLTRMKALTPDVIFVSALPPEKTPILLQAENLGITARLIVSSLTHTEVSAAGDAAEGALTFTGWLPTDETPGNQAFVAKYRQTYGSTPNGFAAVSYATAHIFAAAVSKAEATDAISVRDALAQMQDLDTILGTFAFDANGNGIYEPNVLIVENGKLQPLSESLTDAP